MVYEKPERITRKLFIKAAHCDKCGKRFSMQVGGVYPVSEGITFDGKRYIHYPINAQLCRNCVKKINSTGAVI